MSLSQVLYRCPLCGHDPTTGQGDEARCPACDATFVRASRGVDVVSSGDVSNASMAELVDGIRAHGGPLTAATSAEGQVRYAADAVYHGFVTESPVRKGGRVLGYVERPSEARQGRLQATSEALSFAGGGGGETRWSLGEVTALQVSTRSLQIGIRHRGTLQFTFPEASTFRWEELLQHLLREIWRREGRGEITEFQPRMTTR